MPEYIKLTYKQLKEALPGITPHTTLGTLYSWTGHSKIIRSVKLEQWIYGVIAKMKFNLDDNLGDVFRINWKGIPFHPDDEDIEMP